MIGRHIFALLLKAKVHVPAFVLPVSRTTKLVIYIQLMVGEMTDFIWTNEEITIND